MSSTTNGDSSRSVGTRLRSARERRSLTVLQCAEKLHVDGRLIEALEAEAFASVGAPVYVRGHLRRYAELVGEDPAQMQELYAAGAQAPQPDLTRVPRALVVPESSPLLAPALLVVGVFALVGMTWWVMSLARHRSDTASIAAAAAASPASAPVAAVGADDGSPPPADASAPVLGAALAPAASVKILDTAAAHAVITTPAAAEAAPSGTGAEVPQDADLAIRFSSDSWTEVYDTTGRRLFRDIAPAASVRKLKGKPPFRVVLGNAAAATIEVDGRAVATGGLMRPDGTAQLLVFRSGRAVRAVKSAAGGGAE